MKKLKLLIVAFALMCMIPLGVSAKGKINVYLFRGEGCPHCEEAAEFFDGIDDEYNEYFNLVKYEVWNNTDNASLMESVASKLETEASGVPFIVIGDKYYSGYASSMDEEIKTAIKDAYESDSLRDVLTEVDTSKATPDKAAKSSSSSTEKSTSNDVIALIIIVAVIAGVVALVIYTKKKVNSK